MGCGCRTTEPSLGPTPLPCRSGVVCTCLLPASGETAEFMTEGGGFIEGVMKACDKPSAAPCNVHRGCPGSSVAWGICEWRRFIADNRRASSFNISSNISPGQQLFDMVPGGGITSVLKQVLRSCQASLCRGGRWTFDAGAQGVDHDSRLPAPNRSWRAFRCR